MVDIFDEVEEDLRADRAQAFLKRYGIVFIAVAVLIVAGAGAWQAWRYYADRQRDAIATAYAAAVEASEGVHAAKDAEAARRDAEAAFAKVANMGAPGYRSLARLREAAIAADAGEMAQANELWDSVASDNQADPLLRDLATLTAVMRQVDSADPKQLLFRLAPLLQPDNPWHFLAAEQRALLQLRAGDTAAAKATLQQLTGEAMTPPGVRGRVNLLLAQLGG